MIYQTFAKVSLVSRSKIKVAILGVGNCASSLVQGLEYYKNDDTENGLISDVIGGYKVSDIEIVAAFDINKEKVGIDLSEAIFKEPNNTSKFSEVSKLNIEVNYLSDSAKLKLEESGSNIKIINK